MDNILHSPETFSVYIEAVHAKIEEALQYKKIAFYQDALTRVRAEIELATQAGLDEILEELTALEANLLQRLSPPQDLSETPVALPSLEAEATPNTTQTTEETITEPEPTSEPDDVEALEQALAEEETTQKLLEIRSQWNTLRGKKFRSNAGNWKRTNLLLLRSLASELCGLYSTSTSEDTRNDILYLLADMDRERNNVGDSQKCAMFDEALLGDIDLQETWAYLTEDYKQMATAFEAWEWYEQHKTHLTVPTSVSLLDVIGACQALLYETLKHVEGHDVHQQHLYHQIKEKATLGFLHSLDRNYPLEHLEGLRNKLGEKWEFAKQEFEHRQQEWEQSQAKSNATTEFVALLNSHAEFGSTETEQQQIFAGLDRLIEHKVSHLTKEIRDALIPHVEIFVGWEKYRLFERALRKEIERRTVPPQPEASEEIASVDTNIIQLSFLRAFVKGKKILLLGGTPRPKTVEELRKKLEGAEIEWKESDAGDRVHSFEAEIRRSDILVILQEFVRKQINWSGKEWIHEVGGDYVPVPKGYGVNMIINALYQHLHLKYGEHSE